MFFLFGIIGKIKTRSLLSQHDSPEKTNLRASAYDFSIVFPFMVVTTSKPNNKKYNGYALFVSKTDSVATRVRVNNTYTQYNALGMYE
jgi:hypothetical protein